MPTTNPHDGITPEMFAHISPAVYAEILERHRQAEKWGEQNHPDGTGPTDDALRARADAQFRTDAAAAAGTVTWSDILTEEYREALAESDPRRLHTELVQLAAVATQWADAIQRRGDLPDPNSPAAKMSSLWKQDHS